MTYLYLPFGHFISLSWSEIEFPLSLIKSTDVDHNENEHDKVYQKHDSNGKVKPDSFRKFPCDDKLMRYFLHFFANCKWVVTCEKTLFIAKSWFDGKTFISTKLHNDCQHWDKERNAISTANFNFISVFILLTTTKKLIYYWIRKL